MFRKAMLEVCDDKELNTDGMMHDVNYVIRQGHTVCFEMAIILNVLLNHDEKCRQLLPNYSAGFHNTGFGHAWVEMTMRKSGRKLAFEATADSDLLHDWVGREYRRVDLMSVFFRKENTGYDVVMLEKMAAGRKGVGGESGHEFESRLLEAIWIRISGDACGPLSDSESKALLTDKYSTWFYNRMLLPGFEPFNPEYKADKHTLEEFAKRREEYYRRLSLFKAKYLVDVKGVQV